MGLPRSMCDRSFQSLLLVLVFWGKGDVKTAIAPGDPGGSVFGNPFWLISTCEGFEFPFILRGQPETVIFLLVSLYKTVQQ